MSKHVVFCDGGLSNRLNSLIFCLSLRYKFGHDWKIVWPRNNWCGAAFGSLFDIDLEVVEQDLASFKAMQYDYQLVMHENQASFDEGQMVFQRDLHQFEDYKRLLDAGKPVLYYHNLIPACANTGDLQMGLLQLKIRPEIKLRAESFCQNHQIDDSVLGLHIRKTDFGNSVDDDALYQMVLDNPKRFFVCSDDAEVNRRFGQLENCHVFEKSHFPEKLLAQGDWNSWITDDQGRQFPFNINRSEAATVEALIDLLILSRCTLVRTSGSTFFNMAMIFKGTRFFEAG